MILWIDVAGLRRRKEERVMSKRSGRRGNCDQTGLAGNRGWFFRELGSKKEGGSQQIEYKLPNLHSRVEPLQRRTLSKKSQEKCYLRAM